MTIALWMGLALAGEATGPTGAVYEKLRLRDDAGCAALGVADAALRSELVQMTAEQPEPAWVSVRAAECLVSLYAADAALPGIVEPWFADPDRRGLALVVAGRVGELPEAVAVGVAKAALASTDDAWRARYTTRLQRSGVPAVVKVVEASAK